MPMNIDALDKHRQTNIVITLAATWHVWSTNNGHNVYLYNEQFDKVQLVKVNNTSN